MTTNNEDLPPYIKESFIFELKVLKYILEEEKPIGKGAFGYIYKIKNRITEDICACKVIMIPQIDSNQRISVEKSISQEVTECLFKKDRHYGKMLMLFWNYSNLL